MVLPWLDVQYGACTTGIVQRVRSGSDSTKALFYLFHCYMGIATGCTVQVDQDLHVQAAATLVIDPSPCSAALMGMRRG